MSEEKENPGRTGLEIAVIGMAARFPGAKNIHQFWDNLKNGVESISFFENDQLKEEGIDPELLKNPNYVKAKGVLKEFDNFDASFFGYTPKDAEMMNPQLRVFHECTWEALEDAGYVPDTYEGLIGLYAGASSSFLWEALSAISGKAANLGSWAVTIVDKDYLATRVSYILNLKGPSVSLRTTCSTSLVAVNLAIQGLLSGECDMALAGGVTIMLPGKSGYLYQEGLVQSSDGHCRAFDKKGTGFVGGDGAGIVVLKRLAEAIDHRDYIYAVVKGSAVNNDGLRKVGFTAPSVEGQIDVITTAQQLANVEPECIGYIETHGTATALGDSIEIEALKQVFSNTDKKNFCAIGSVKTNIGHLDSAAGISGFIKTVLALKNRMIPPSLNFEVPNPQLVLIDSPFYVNDSLCRWERDNGYHTLKAGVSSFGIGGTNAHVVLEEAPEIEISTPGRKYQLIMLSAKTETALDRSIDNLSRYLKSNKNINLANVAYTLQVGRKAFQYRTVSVCSDVNEAIQSLVHPDPTAPVGNCTRFSSSLEETERSVVFIFPGEGSQYINMGWGLYREEPRFRRRMQRCFDILRTETGYDMELEFQHPGKQEKNLMDPGTLHPFIFIFEYALAKLLMEWGITPALMMGYDIGEYVAAQISGIFSLEDALALVALRGTLIQQTRCGYLEESSALNRFRERLDRVSFNKSSIPYISCTHGTWISDQEAANPEYWVTHMQVRKNIHLTGEIGQLIQKQDQILVEMGTGQDLCKRLEQHREKSFGPLAVPMVRQSTESIPDTYFLLKQIGHLWLNGISMNYDSFYSPEKRCRIPLPAYPFEKRKFKVEIPRLNASFSYILQEKPDIIENPGVSSSSSTPANVEPPRLKKMPLNEVEEKICSLLENILGIENISVEKDLSQLGLDSLKTIILGIEIYKVLQVKIQLEVLFELSNIKELARCISRIQQDGAGAGTNANEEVPGVSFPVKEEVKFKPQPNWNTDEISDAREVPGHILLTGATGFFGSHVLRDIVDKTGAKIYCLLRGNTVADAVRRLKQALIHYFDSTYEKHLERRIVVIKGDITRSRLGMEPSCYDELAGTIDAVIHSAADVRHYGKYKDFKKTNVESTQKIIDFCFYGKEKKLHHISTIGVVGTPSQPVTFKEWDLDIGQSFEGLVYSKSKFEAEMLVYRARERGLKSSIYRVGNLVGRWKDGVFQENIQTNQLYNDIKALVHLGKSPANLENEGIEITPVDLCSQSLFNLFLLKGALGYNFHLMNSYRIPLGKLIRFMNRFGFQIDLVNFETFHNLVYSEVKSKPFIKALSGIFYDLQPGDDGSANGLSRVTFDDTFTVQVLKKTGFSWTPLNFDYISKMLKYCIDVGYLTFR